MASTTDGTERVIATAQQILKSLSNNGDNATEDMLRILFSFDDRFILLNQSNSSNTYSYKNGEMQDSDAIELPQSFQNVKETILKWEKQIPEASRKLHIWSGDDGHDGGLQAQSYLHAVDELQHFTGCLSLSRSQTQDSHEAQSLLQLAMARLSIEFRHLLVSHSATADSDWVQELSSVTSTVTDNLVSSEDTESVNGSHCNETVSIHQYSISKDGDHHHGMEYVTTDRSRDGSYAQDHRDKSIDGDRHRCSDENYAQDQSDKSMDDNHYSDSDVSGHYEDVDYDDEANTLSASQGSDHLHSSIELLHGDVISDLHSIAKRMVASGFGHECVHIYSSVRKTILDGNLSMLGIERFTIDDIHNMPWEHLQVRIKRWVHALKVAINIFYASERKLCEQVFAGLSPWKEGTFLELTRGSVVKLLSFGEAMAISRRSPEKLFKILDMYETLQDVMPDINRVFSDEICAGVRSEASGILMRLGQAARGTFAEFENAIQRDTPKNAVPGGAVHPLTRYVINYIWLLFSYKGTLSRLLGERRFVVSVHGNEAVSNGFLDGTHFETDRLSPLAVQMIWLIVVLECNLDTKSKLYKDAALSYFFLMNNSHYIVQKVKKSELSSLIGEDWMRRHSLQVKQYAASYVRAAWMKVFGCLRKDGLNSTFSGRVSRWALKERFKTFNALFEELVQTQSLWIVSDSELREELRLLISEKLLPAYSSFLLQFRHYLESERRPEKYIKYTVEDINRCLLDLFKGASSTMSARRKSTS